MDSKNLKVFSKVALGAAFVFAGTNHFLHAAVYARIIPNYLPAHELLVSVSGAIEIILGAALFIKRWTRWAAWLLIALLIAVFPANVQMAVHPELFPEFSPLLYWVRLPVQVLLIWWVHWHTR